MARTRSTQAHKSVLQAAIQLMAERGIDAASMDAIAEKAGVSKATIYNHWADKDELLLEAMADLHGLRDRPDFDSGDTKADVIGVLAHQPSQKRGLLQHQLMPHFMAYAARNPSFGIAWRKMAMEPPRQELTRLLTQAVARGELAPLPDLGLALALLLGPMLYHHIFVMNKGQCPQPDQQPDKAKNTAALAALVVDAFWNAFQPPARE